MIVAEMAAFDNISNLKTMADDLASFVQQAAAEGKAAHEVEMGVWERVLAMGRQAHESDHVNAGPGMQIGLVCD